jgi:twitching motility two-component system response regulator PilH
MHTILVTDDSAFQRFRIKEIISAKGYNVIEAANGKEALAKIASDSPDIIVSDLLMPEMTGFELIEEVQKLDNPIPIVVLTADIQDSSKERCLELGAIDFVNKPPKKQRLYEAIEKAISIISE